MQTLAYGHFHQSLKVPVVTTRPMAMTTWPPDPHAPAPRGPCVCEGLSGAALRLNSSSLALMISKINMTPAYLVSHLVKGVALLECVFEEMIGLRVQLKHQWDYLSIVTRQTGYPHYQALSAASLGLMKPPN